MDFTNTAAAINVSIIAMGVIFLVLSILIVTIKLLERMMPYKAPPTPPPAKQRPSGNDDTLVAVITSAMVSYCGQSPDQFRITNIKRQ